MMVHPREQLEGCRILLIEDEAELRQEVQEFLVGRGMLVYAAQDVEGAKVLAASHEIDLILSDLWLGQETSFAFLRRMRSFSRPPCLVMTAQDGIRSIVLGVSTGADDFIQKPLKLSELLDRLVTLYRIAQSRNTTAGRFLRDPSGAISIVGAVSLAALVAIAALVIDSGSLYFARRNLQATSDAAALAAVQNPTNAATIANAVFVSNGYASPNLIVTTGTYSANEATSAQNRFAASSSNINAVRVHATLNQATYFSPYFGLGRTFSLVTQSTAARAPTATIGIGTVLARLNAGVINRVLGQLWGSTVSLSLIDYQALTTTNVQALPFLNRLAANINVTGSYQQLANASVTMSQLLTALAQTVGTSGSGNVAGAALALQSLQNQLGAGSSMPLSKIVDLSPLHGRTIGAIVPVSNPTLQLNLMNLLSASARTAAAGHLINAGTALTIPVTNSSVSTRLAVGSQMTQVSMATPGSSITTAQIRLALTPTLASVNLGVITTAVQVPLYLEAAQGQATLISLPCTTAGDRAQLSATSGLTTVRFGTVTDAALTNFAVPVVPTATPVVSVTLLGIPVQIGISGTSNVAASGPTTLDFTQADIQNGTVKTVSSGSPSPFSALGGSFTLSSNVAGNPLLSATVNTLLGNLKPVVSSLISPLDSPVNQLLTSLGLALGSTDVRVFDVSCRTPTLVG